MAPRKQEPDNPAAKDSPSPTASGDHDPSVDPDGTGADRPESSAGAPHVPDTFQTDQAEAERARHAEQG